MQRSPLFAWLSSKFLSQWSAFCILLPLLLSQTVISQQQQVLTTYPIAWDQVAVPASTSKNLTSNCICDLTRFQCDLGCCCDPYCPVVLSANFSSSGTCLREGPPAETLKYCIPKGFVQKVNLPANSDFYDISIQAAQQQFFSQLLCIVSSSNPNLGPTYPDPTAGDSGDNAALATCSPQVAPYTPSNAYTYGRQISIVRYTSSNQQLSGVLQVPFPAFSQVCNDQLPVGYLIPTPVGQRSKSVFCQRLFATPEDTKAQCSADTPLSPTYWTKMAYYSAPRASVTPAAVTVTRVQVLDPLTGGLSTFLLGDPIITYNASSSNCAMAVLSLNITIYYTPSNTTTTGTAKTRVVRHHDNNGVIDKITVDLVLTSFQGATLVTHPATNATLSSSNTTNVTTTLAAGTPAYNTTVPGSFQQYFSVSWLRTANSTPSSSTPATGINVTTPAAAATDTRIVESFSGNPGYINGFPVLAGFLATGTAAGAQAVERFVQGLPLPGPADEGACGVGGLSPVGFGFNISSTCAITHTLASLKTFCTQQATSPQYYVEAALAGMYADILAGKLYVGIWGNSDFNNTNQWLKVQVTNAPSQNLVQSGDSCGNIVVGYDVQLLWGVAFAANNLQQKVLYVNICFKTGTWTYPPSIADTSNSVRFYMNYTTTFTSLDQSKSVYEVTKPAPPLAAPLPYDIFYPFLVGSSSDALPLIPRPATLILLTSTIATALVVLVLQTV